MRRVFWVGLLLAALLLPSSGQAATVKLTWTDNANNEDGFNVERKAESCLLTGALSPFAQTAANATGYDDATVVEGTAYCYRVNAYNASGVSAWSNTISMIVPYTATGTPGTVAVSAAGKLTWVDKTPNETGFVIQRKGEVCAGTGAWAQLATVGAGVVEYTDSTGVAGTPYCYRVAAMSAVSLTPYSAGVERAASPLALPAAPSQLGATLVP